MRQGGLHCENLLYKCPELNNLNPPASSELRLKPVLAVTPAVSRACNCLGIRPPVLPATTQVTVHATQAYQQRNCIMHV